MPGTSPHMGKHSSEQTPLSPCPHEVYIPSGRKTKKGNK